MELSVSSLGRRPAAPQGNQAAVTCSACGSTLVQLQGWHELPGSRLELRLRCPECLESTIGRFEHKCVEAYDDEWTRGRDSLLADHEALVRHNMEELASRFGQALALDLIGAEDFGPRDFGARRPQLAARRGGTIARDDDD